MKLTASIYIFVGLQIATLISAVLGNCGSSPVAFRASKTKKENVEETVIFEKVGLNQYGGYNRSTGIFTAPCNGTYIFSWTISTKQKLAIGTKLVVDGKTVGRTYADARDAADSMDDTGSNTVPVAMEKGQQAQIKVSSTWDTYVEGSDYSSFSGWKLSC